MQLWNQSTAWSNALEIHPHGVHGSTASITLFEAALTDTKARAVLDQRLDAATAAPLEVEPGGPSQQDRKAAEDLAEQLTALEIDRIWRELGHAIWYGYAFAECIWSMEGPRVRLLDLRVRPPTALRWHPRSLHPLLITQKHPAGLPLPPAKFVVFTNPRSHGGQPHGPGLANWCVWPVWLKRIKGTMYRNWALALQRFGTPLALAYVRKDAPAEEVSQALDALAALAAGASLAVPENVRLETLESARRAGGDYEVFARDMDRMIASALIGQHGTSEIGPHVGTGEVHMKVLERLITADARRLADALRRSVAAWLTGWNHPGGAVPRLRRDTAPPEDLESRARRDLALAQASGMRPTKGTIEAVYGRQWEPTPSPAPLSQGPQGSQPSHPSQGSRGSHPSRTMARALLAQGQDDAVDSALATLLGDGEWQPLMEPMLVPLRKEVASTDDYAPLQQSLGSTALFEAMGNSRLPERLAQTSTSATLTAAGAQDAQERDQQSETQARCHHNETPYAE